MWPYSFNNAGLIRTHGIKNLMFNEQIYAKIKLLTTREEDSDWQHVL